MTEYYNTDALIDIAPETDRLILKGSLQIDDEIAFMIRLFEFLNENPVKIVDVLKILFKDHVENGGNGTNWVRHTVDLIKALPDIDYFRRRSVFSHVKLFDTTPIQKQGTADYARQIWQQIHDGEIDPPPVKYGTRGPWFLELCEGTTHDPDVLSRRYREVVTKKGDPLK